MHGVDLLGVDEDQNMIEKMNLDAGCMNGVDLLEVDEDQTRIEKMRI